MEKIPKLIKNKCPDKCPKCEKKVWGIFREWHPDRSIVKVDFMHIGIKKDCVKIYKY